MANEAGQGCADRSAAVSAYTFVSQGAPASQGGSCNKLEVYANPADVASVFKFNFFTASGNSLTAIGTAISIAAGAVGAQCYTYTAPGDFTAFSVNSGEYLGCYFVNGQDYALSGGSGLWYKSGDQSGASGVALTFDADGIDGLSADIVAAGGVAPTSTIYGPLYGPFAGPI